MPKIVCRTNLDLYNEAWPCFLPEVPRIGDKIQSSVKHGVFQLCLEVINVTWRYCKAEQELDSYWYPEIELHIPKHKMMNIVEFYEWYAPLVGRSVSSFI